LIKNIKLTFEYECPITRETIKVENFPIEKTELSGDLDNILSMNIEFECQKCWEFHYASFQYE